MLAWAFHGRGLDVGEALWAGVFHAVAAFCHAGFSLCRTRWCRSRTRRAGAGRAHGADAGREPQGFQVLN